MAEQRGGPPEAWWARPPSTASRAKATAAPQVTGAVRRPAAKTITPAPRTPPSTGAPLGDQRGLTAAGATLLVLVLGGLAAGVDVATGTGLRTVFAVAFAIAAALGAATVHHEDLAASVVLVPLAFALIGGISGIAEGSGLHSVSKLMLAVANVMVTAAPALMFATGAAAALALLRWYAVRRRNRAPWRRSAPAR